MTLKILESAVEDLERGRRFYARHGQGVGVYFLDSLFSDIDSLLLYAGIHPRSFGYHRLLSKRFPFAVYYLIEDDVVIVYRVLDLRQNPESIRVYLKPDDQPEQG
ncbi:MAG: type II toxin-antitoxin system RelE/ParE family toxin [Spirochaetaceae bacterium]|nr:MAG: type II toxin-antitoxin system RelE/ParE family toxin [Spirochaetaceae bacterium]